MINIIDSSFDEIIFTKFTYTRSAESSELYQLSNSKNKLLFDSINEAVDYTLNNECDFTLFMGSLYLVSEIRPLILNKKN